jgi:hypothetical protein
LRNIDQEDNPEVRKALQEVYSAVMLYKLEDFGKNRLVQTRTDETQNEEKDSVGMSFEA